MSSVIKKNPTVVLHYYVLRMLGNSLSPGSRKTVDSKGRFFGKLKRLCSSFAELKKARIQKNIPEGAECSSRDSRFKALLGQV